MPALTPATLLSLVLAVILPRRLHHLCHACSRRIGRQRSRRALQEGQQLRKAGPSRRHVL
jgi:hypothetical protein